MKTTVELNDVIISQLKKQAQEKKTSMKELIETALRLYLDKQESSKTLYHFEKTTFKGNGVCEGVEEGAWMSLRSTIYEGRGG